MKLLKRILIVTVLLVTILVCGLFLFLKLYTPPLSENSGKVDAELFVGESDDQPLIVAFGGSQGGNTWTEDYWAEMRDKFLKQGYAVLSIGYFKTENTPETLDRISLDAIYDTIKKISNHPKINGDRIMLLGSSRGGELVLNLASRYEDIDAVVALVPPYATFPAGSITANTSAWTFNGKELPYFPISFKAILTSITSSSQSAWKIILENERNAQRSEIEVEKIDGPILLLSAKDDEVWPSQYMCGKIVKRLKVNNFKHYFEHISIDGGHYETKKHFGKVFEFLNSHFK